MLHSNKNRDDLENINEIIWLQNQVEELRQKDKSGKKNFHEVMEILYEPLTNTIKDTSLDITKTMMETSIENNKTREYKRQTFWNID